MIEGCSTLRLYLPCLPGPVPVPDHENVIRQTYPPLLVSIIETRGDMDMIYLDIAIAAVMGLGLILAVRCIACSLDI